MSHRQSINDTGDETALSSIAWSRADLHVHSTYSDGGHDIRSILEHAASHTDLRIVAITDHDTIEGALEARRLGPHYGIEVVVGEEISTTRGHVLGLFLRERVQPGLSIPETVGEIHAQGGVAVLAHPFDRICNNPMRHHPRPTLEDWRSFGLDALEGLNGSQLDPLANPRARVLGAGLRLALTAGSDAHHKGVVGVSYTLFQGTTAADLRRAIEQRTCIPCGRRWRLREYLGWLAIALVPRTLHRTRLPQPTPLPDPIEA